MLEKSLECLLDSEEIKPVNSKGKQPRIFIGRTVAESETPNPLPNSLEKIKMMGKIEGKRKKGRQKM